MKPCSQVLSMLSLTYCSGSWCSIGLDYVTIVGRVCGGKVSEVYRAIFPTCLLTKNEDEEQTTGTTARSSLTRGGTTNTNTTLTLIDFFFL